MDAEMSAAALVGQWAVVAIVIGVLGFVIYNAGRKMQDVDLEMENERRREQAELTKRWAATEGPDAEEFGVIKQSTGKKKDD